MPFLHLLINFKKHKLFLSKNNYGDVKKAMSIAKEEAKKLTDELPDHATWDDIMYEQKQVLD
jgi:hypothetical protein